jgi:hypothetical protein
MSQREMVFPYRMLFRPGPLLLTQNLALIIYCLLQNFIFKFYIPSKMSLRVP